METNRLVQFSAVVETGNLRKAAQILKMSHGALSKSLKVLEEQLNVELFRQIGRGLQLTDNGLIIYRKSHDIVRLVNDLSKCLPKRTENVIRLGTFEVFSTYFLSKLMANYLPDSAIELHELLPGHLEEALEAGKIDFGITLEPAPRRGMEFHKITQIVMGAYAKTGSYVACAFEMIPFAAPVNPVTGVGSSIRSLDGWPELEFPRYVKYRVDMIETALDLAREGLCALFIPCFFAKLQNDRSTSENRLEELNLPAGMKAVKRDVYLVTRDSTLESKEMKKVAKAIREICRV